MQTVQPLRRLAVVAESPVFCSGCRNSIQNLVCCPSRNLGPIRQVSTQIISPGRQVTSVDFAYQSSRSISAVRHPMRREMLASRAKLVRRSRFAPAAKPPVSSFRAAPGAAYPSLAALRRLRTTSLMANQVRRALQGKHKQCSIVPCHCLPQPRMRCLTTRSTGPIAACG